MSMFPNHNTSKDAYHNSNNAGNSMGIYPSNHNAPVSLERKLELLESRFTTPADGGGGMAVFGSPSGPTTTTATTTGELSSPPAAAAAEPPLPSDTVHNQNSSSPSTLGGSNHSEHSFSFSTPMSRTASNAASNHSGSTSNLPSSSVRSKLRASLNTSFHAVSRAATRHLRKVASQQQHQQHQPLNTNSNASSAPLPSSLLVMHDGNRSLSGLPSNSNSRASSRSASNQTLLTSHVRTQTTNTQQHRAWTAQQQRPHHPQVQVQAHHELQESQLQQQQQQVVVAESPPVFVTPHGSTPAVATKGDPSKPAAARNLVMTSAAHVTTTPKRKSVPKRKKSSVKDKSIVTSPSGSNTTSDPYKRPRRHSNASAEGAASSSPKQKHMFYTNASAVAQSEHSRGGGGGERSNPPPPPSTTTTKTTKAVSSKSGKAPANNKSLLDFFASGPQKKKASGALPSSNGVGVAAVAVGGAGGGVPPTTTTHPSSGAPSGTENEWFQRYQQLQQQLQDKNEQIKAITDNRTIYQTALQSALTKTKAELTSTKEKLETHTKETSRVMEELLRWKSSRQAKELREKLAADGARLGRIVVSRAGMRAVESWEEGHATKDLEHRKVELQAKRQTLERRLTSIRAREASASSTSTSTTYPPRTTPEDGNKENQHGTKQDEEDKQTYSSTMTELELVEAKEAIRMHLDNLRRSERELSEEEQALNDEKGTHIRALKQVASEDASRFRTRPKLHNRYVLHCLLGKGGFSEVWRGYDLVELREVAVKIHQLDPRWPDSKKENYTRHVSREYEIHRNVRHSRIVSLYDVFEIDNNSFATVLECCKGTDLDTLLKSKKRLPEQDARAILLQILTGMQYLSQASADGTRQGIIHYDLKPGNILFDEFGDAKITDFGLSKIVDTPDPAESMELTSQGAGTYWYLPPECFITSERVRISNKVDVWSIGVIYYQMLYGKRPFGEGKSQDKLLTDHTMLNAQQVHFPDKPQVSEAGKVFLRQCLMYDQAFRPTVAQLCENSYVLKQQF